MKKEKPTTKTCKHCKTEMPIDEKVCPNCGKKQANGCLIAIIALVVVIVILALPFGGSDDTKEPESKSTETTETTETTKPEKLTETSAPAKTETKPTETMGQKNAVRKALSYLDYSAFSYSGLINQLEYEGFSTEDATYGADNCGADWNEQAARKAQDYLDYSSFSRDGLIDQLKYEGFTAEQAEYGVTAVGY